MKKLVLIFGLFLTFLTEGAAQIDLSKNKEFVEIKTDTLVFDSFLQNQQAVSSVIVRDTVLRSITTKLVFSSPAARNRYVKKMREQVIQEISQSANDAALREKRRKEQGDRLKEFEKVKD